MDFPDVFSYPRRSDFPSQTGRWFKPAGNVVNPNVLNNGQLRVMPLVGMGGVSIDQLCFEVVTTPGGVGSLQTVCIYADNGQFFPGNVLFDSGQINTETLGQKVVSAPLILPNICWIGGVQQGAPAPAATVRIMGGPSQDGLISAPNVSSILGGNSLAYVAGGVTGALPNPWPTSPASTDTGINCLLVALRRA